MHETAPLTERTGRAVGALLCWLAAGRVIWWAAPPVPIDPAGLRRWVTLAEPDELAGALAVAAAALVLGWLAIAAVCCAAAELPGLLGRLGTDLADRLAPGVLRRIVHAAIGGTVLGAGLAPLSALPAAASAGSTRLPSLDRPVSTRPASAPPVPTPQVGPTSQRPAVARDTVIVRAGDTLWGIAAERLGEPATDARIAASWPAWYAANRATIGPDPDLLRPGQRLHAPAQVQR